MGIVAVLVGSVISIVACAFLLFAGVSLWVVAICYPLIGILATFAFIGSDTLRVAYTRRNQARAEGSIAKPGVLAPLPTQAATSCQSFSK